MYVRTGGLRITGYAGIVSRVLGCSAVYEQSASLGGTIRSYIDPTVPIVIDHAVIVVPEHVARGLGAGDQIAHQAKGAAQFQVLLRWPSYLGSGLCNSQYFIVYFFYLPYLLIAATDNSAISATWSRHVQCMIYIITVLKVRKKRSPIYLHREKSYIRSSFTVSSTIKPLPFI